MARILFVDDERDIVATARLWLEEAGYEFEGVYDGLEAIRAVQANRPDLVILDVTMPRLNGRDTLRVLQDDPKTADIPVIMLTAMSSDADIHVGWKLGCTFYQTKPFVWDELLVLVRRILSEQEGEE